jgi:hypothetical protein
VTAAASRLVSKKSCHSAKQHLLSKRKAFSALRKTARVVPKAVFFMAFRFDVTVLLHTTAKVQTLFFAQKNGLAFECKAIKNWRLKTWVGPSDSRV